jgi:hypothetical protein
MNNKILASFAVAAAFAISTPGNATTVSITSESNTDFTVGTVPGSTSNPAPTVLTPGPSAIIFPTVSLAFQYRDPFELQSGAPGPGYGTLKYTSIFTGGTGTWTVAALGVAGGSADHLSIIWGSPDSYNKLSFYSGPVGSGTLLDSFSGLNLAIDHTKPVKGHDIVTFATDVGFFNYVVLTTTANAFEFTNLEAACTECAPPPSTPLPAALPLFVGGLGTLGFFARRRKRKAAAAVAA